MQMLCRSSISCIGGSDKFLQYQRTVSTKACSYWPDAVIPEGLNFSWGEITVSKAVRRRATAHERYTKSSWANHSFYKGQLLEDSDDEAPPAGYKVVDPESIVDEPVDGAEDCDDSDSDFTVTERGASSSRTRKRIRSAIAVPSSGDDDYQVQGVGDRWNGEFTPGAFRESDAGPSARSDGVSDVDGLDDADDDDDLQVMEVDGLSQAPLEDVTTGTDALMDEGADNSSVPDDHCAGTFLSGRAETSISPEASTPRTTESAPPAVAGPVDPVVHGSGTPSCSSASRAPIARAVQQAELPTSTAPPSQSVEVQAVPQNTPPMSGLAPQTVAYIKSLEASLESAKAMAELKAQETERMRNQLMSASGASTSSHVINLDDEDDEELESRCNQLTRANEESERKLREDLAKALPDGPAPKDKDAGGDSKDVKPDVKPTVDWVVGQVQHARRGDMRKIKEMASNMQMMQANQLEMQSVMQKMMEMQMLRGNTILPPYGYHPGPYPQYAYHPGAYPGASGMHPPPPPYSDQSGMHPPPPVFPGQSAMHPSPSMYPGQSGMHTPPPLYQNSTPMHPPPPVLLDATAMFPPPPPYQQSPAMYPPPPGYPSATGMLPPPPVQPDSTGSQAMSVPIPYVGPPQGPQLAAPSDIPTSDQSTASPACSTPVLAPPVVPADSSTPAAPESERPPNTEAATASVPTAEPDVHPVQQVVAAPGADTAAVESTALAAVSLLPDSNPEDLHLSLYDQMLLDQKVTIPCPDEEKPFRLEVVLSIG